jgi:hypothetical protein
MGYKIYFASYDEIMSFIDYSDEILLWGTKKFTLTSSSNAVMNIDTHNYTSGDIRNYIAFSSLKTYINQYYINNGYLPIMVDVKLVCPESYRKSIDPNNYYSYFYMNIYSHQTINYLNLTYDENGIELITEPFTSWVAYVLTMYNKWKAYYES